MNAEVDATIGWLLHHEAAAAGRIYTIGDGDQPGVLLRQLDFVSLMGIEMVAAVNCKRNLDVHQNPDDSRPYAERDGTSVLMTTAFGDGTKMQIENAVVANLTGLVPDRRGMHGVSTTVERAADDISAAISRHGVVEYTRGGDFGGGVGVVGLRRGPMVQPYMRYGKLGDGPYYFYFRPYHLLHFEVPMTIADVVLDRVDPRRTRGAHRWPRWWRSRSGTSRRASRSTGSAGLRATDTWAPSSRRQGAAADRAVGARPLGGGRRTGRPGAARGGRARRGRPYRRPSSAPG